MPYASNGGVRIHYHLDGNEAGPPLVLQHGFGGSLEVLYETGYVAALGASHRLVLLDARGHGGSDKPHDPEAYRVATMAADVVAVLDQLGLARAHFLGYSMGAVIGFGLAAHAPSRCLSLILGGQAASDRNPDAPDPFAPLLRRGPQALADAVRHIVPPAEYERVLRADTEALLAMRTLVERRGFAEALPRVEIPCLLYCGDADPQHDAVRATATLMPRARFISLPGLDHVAGYQRSEVVLPHITAFLTDVDAQGWSD